MDKSDSNSTYTVPEVGSEKYLNIRIVVSEEATELSMNVDAQFKKRVRKIVGSGNWQDKCLVLKGIASLTWKNPQSRDECRIHNSSRRGREGQTRWENICQSVGQMRQGDFPEYGFVLFDQGTSVLQVLDGTRRSIALLEFGRQQVPVRILRFND
ncbi:MAG: hypothetical protein AAFN77_24250 [Planctomycetota bacterium]